MACPGFAGRPPPRASTAIRPSTGASLSVRWLRALPALVLLMPRASLADGWVSDSWITTKTKIALLTTEGFTARDVSVDTVEGKVSLFGKVASAEEKRRAEEVPKQIDGVTAVRDFL